VTVLVDSGVFIAAADRDQPAHGICARVLREHRDQLIVPSPVVPETAWFIEDRLGSAAEASFVRLIISMDVIDLVPIDYRRIVELIEIYADLGLGFVDASIVAVAERLNVSRLATLNHRDFSVVRPAHVAAFELLPT
jgi:predicted nucleic acid-binding protein